MYKLMLVDDERDIIEGLTEIVPFHDLGFTLVGQAGNGVEALRICDEVQPDLVVTDIRMPLMNGLDMCKEIHRRQPACQFIILSGYDDFEYARTALDIKALHYLLKPISSPEFIEIMKTTRIQLDEEFAKRRDVDRLRAHYHESLPLLREMLLSSLVRGAISVDVFCATAARYGLQTQAPQYAVAAIRIGEAVKNDGPGINDPELEAFAVMNIAQEVMAASCESYAFHLDGLIGMLLLLPDATEGAYTKTQEGLEEMRGTVAHYLGLRLLIGLGAPCFRLEDLTVCHHQALSALNQSMLWGGSALVCSTDLEPGASTEVPLNESELRQLSNALKVGDKATADDTIAQMMARCMRAAPSLSAYRAFLMEIVLAFNRCARDMNIELDLLDEECSGILAGVNEPAETEKQLHALADRFLGDIARQKIGTSKTLVRQAQDYLHQHYADADFGVERLCKALHVSSSYLSALYKRETQETFHQALTRLRMDQAMTLITSTDMKNTDVASAVGIPDPSYFSYAFRHYFGMSPSQARTGKGIRP